MTDYAFDTTRNVITRFWTTGDALASGDLAEVPDSVSGQDALSLADSLTRLARRLWSVYANPASAVETHEPNTDGWRRRGERDAFDEVLDALRDPNLPQNGLVLQSYIPSLELAHHVGRLLHRIDAPELADRVAAEVREEIEAIGDAERGELSGRSRQAVVLSRADASPLQVVAANEILHEWPLGSSRLFTDVDGTAAAVAAAHWLSAAAEVTGELSGYEPSSVVLEADNIEALAVQTPTLVLRRIEEGERPLDVVVDLVRGAMEVAAGRIHEPHVLMEEIALAWAKAEQYGPGDDELMRDLMPRLTPLDLQRPAHDLLEGLIGGIYGCLLLYREYVEYDDDEVVLDDIDEDAADELDRAIDAAFVEEVRRVAAERASRGE